VQKKPAINSYSQLTVTANDVKEIDLNNVNFNVIKYCPQNYLNALLKLPQSFTNNKIC
jgi:hypothetical protein